MGTILWILALLVVGAACAFAGYTYRRSMIEKKIDRSEETARRLYDEAVRKADDYKKEKVAEARAEINKSRDELQRSRDDVEKSRRAVEAEKAAGEQDLRERRAEVQRTENRLMQREASLDKRSDSLDARESDLTKRNETLDRKLEEADRQCQEAEELHRKQTAELERIAAMTQDEAKQIIIDRVQREAYHDAAAHVRDAETRAKEEAEKKARNIIALAIQRCAADHVAESTVSAIALPNDDMKGRIIGREGRNIRALETATGVDLLIDDTPETVIVSAFDPVRREVARLTVEKLINDGRIHPARIEETVEKAKKEVEQQIREAGEAAVFETNQHGIHHELVKLLGRLRYRTSYGQNVLKHAIEVSHVAGLMASELGADVQLAKRAGLLHDIGKAVDHEADGTHVTLGGELARKYNESPDVIHAILAHHNDVEPQTIEAVLVQAADAISAARPGARRESLENYIKRLTKLEEIATSFPGVEKCYAIQSGREVRIMVKPDDVTDEGTRVLAKEIAKRIEQEMEYPGQIRVNVIRETRSMEYAK